MCMELPSFCHKCTAPERFNWYGFDTMHSFFCEGIMLLKKHQCTSFVHLWCKMQKSSALSRRESVVHRFRTLSTIMGLTFLQASDRHTNWQGLLSVTRYYRLISRSSLDMYNKTLVLSLEETMVKNLMPLQSAFSICIKHRSICICKQKRLSKPHDGIFCLISDWLLKPSLIWHVEVLLSIPPRYPTCQALAG